jgi:GAF domain-containing protein
VLEEQADQSWDAVIAAARELQSSGSNDVLQHIVDIAVTRLDGCSRAGVSVDRNGRLSSPIVSDADVLAIDALQYSIESGPCVEAMRGTQVSVDAPDLANDERFQPFGAEAARSNCRAVLSHRLHGDARTLGSLNFYSTVAHGFSDDDRRRAGSLAALASLAFHAMVVQEDAEGLREAILSRDVIGQAKGILMQRHGVSADEAFTQLQSTSQARNVKLRDVAREIVESVAVGRASWGEQ